MVGGDSSPIVRLVLCSGLVLALAGCLNRERQLASVLSGPALDPEIDAPVTTLVGDASTAAES